MNGGRQNWEAHGKIPGSLCASGDGNWHDINWQTINRHVRTLQARIVKAEREGRIGKVKALQIILTKSFAARALAVRRVTENQGKRTPGVDGITWDSSQEKTLAIQRLRRRGYHAQPLRRVWIPKANGKQRPLGIPTMKDRAMQALYLLALDPVAEERADHCSFGFRKYRSCADAIELCHKLFSRKYSPVWVLEGDIKGCFDNISHEWLIQNVPLDKKVLRTWLKAGYIHKHIFNETTAGTPQGGIISPALANMALDGLEGKLNQKFKYQSQGRWYCRPPRVNQHVNLTRYADDFIISGVSKEVLEKEVKPMVIEFLAERGLELSEEKTRITHIEEGFDFLGQNVRKYRNGKTIIKPSKKNVLAFAEKIRKEIKTNLTAKAGNLIAILNPKIRGWANYHRHICAKATFSRMDHAIWETLWWWSKRRHKGKSERWIKAKYFPRVGSRNWVFSGISDDGKMQRLIRADSIPIKRHAQIKGALNPYDPAWENYLAGRTAKYWNFPKSDPVLKALTHRQKANCPICNGIISIASGHHIHHLVPKSQGGTDDLDNLVMLHPVCHQQIHANPSFNRVLSRCLDGSLSGMRGNSHVPF